jgi:hypothetical protein
MVLSNTVSLLSSVSMLTKNGVLCNCFWYSVSIFQVNEQTRQALGTVQFSHAASAMAAVDDMDEKVML